MLSRSRSTSRDAALQAVSSGRVPGNSGRWRIASSGCPDGFGMATGKRLASLSSTSPESTPWYGAKGREPYTLPVE